MHSASQKPFFSILITTRNRPELCADALASVESQSFHDYEVLISNNGSDRRTKEIALSQCNKDKRFRYAEYDNLSMHDHWEQASLQLDGQYMTILTDRCLLFRDSLKTIYDNLSIFDFPQIASWKMMQYLDDSGMLLNYSPTYSDRPGQTECVSPREIILDELNGKNKSWSEKLPRGLDSAVSMQFLRALRKEFGQIFRPISPDFTFATLTTLNASSMIFIDKPLYISRGMSVSNGGNSYSGSVNPEFVDSIGPEYQWFSNVPCKAMLVINTIFDDYLALSQICGQPALRDALNLPSYYAKLLDELEVKAISSIITKDELKKLSVEIQSSITDQYLKLRVEDRINSILPKHGKPNLKYWLISLANSYSPRILNVLRSVMIASRGYGLHFETAYDTSQNYKP